MKSIAIIIPYFGELPNLFPIWLRTVKENNDIDWILITDDIKKYDYPKNVHVMYSEFSEIKKRIRKLYDFDIYLEDPYKLCDYRVAYGDIFKDILSGYDFWGHCDLDVIFGDIRKFINDDILSKYQKIQYRGHLTLYKNNEEVNTRYKLKFNGEEIYKEIFRDKRMRFFDEEIINHIYEQYNIPYYKVVNFAEFKIRRYNFWLLHLPDKYDYKNKNQIFYWKNGSLIRLYLFNDEIYEEEFMYVHFLKRDMDMNINIDNISDIKEFVIYPNKIDEFQENIDASYIKKHSKNKLYFKYYLKRLNFNFILNKIKQIVWDRRI